MAPKSSFARTSATGQSRDNSEQQLAPRDWKLKQVDPKAIEAARTAAKRNGMRLGAWVTHAINNMADEQFVGERTDEKPTLLKISQDLTGFLDIQTNTAEHLVREIENIYKELKFVRLGLASKLHAGEGSG